jgi:hypothetical protein
MRKLLLLLTFVIPAAFAQYADLPTNIRVSDMPAAINANFAVTLKFTEGTSIPGTCTAGQVFHKTDTNQWYDCMSTNVFGLRINASTSGIATFNGAGFTPRTIGAGANQRPSASSCTNCVIVVNDAANASDCTIGLGSSISLCRSNGTAWSTLGGGAGGTDPNAVPNTRTVNGHVLSADIAVTKSDVGLANADNTSDVNKPISTAAATALGNKVDTSRQINGHALTTDVTVTKTDLGLNNVTNVAQEPALGNPSTNGYILTSTTSGTRSWTSPGAATAAGSTGNMQYNAGGVLAGASITDCVSTGGVLNYNASTHTFSCHTLIAADIPTVYPAAGIPQSTSSAWGSSLTLDTDGTLSANSDSRLATQKAINTKIAAGLASPAFSGTPTAPTASAGTNTTQIATTSFVTTAVGAAAGPVANSAWIPFAGCNATTAGAAIDLPSSNAPTPNCYGTSRRFGALDYADSANSTGTFSFPLPTGWTGNVDFTTRAFANASSQSFKLTVATACVATGEDTLNPTFNTAQTITTTSPGTANQLFDFSQNTLTMTGCSVGETLIIKVGRDVTDTSTATFSAIGAFVTIRIIAQP